MVGCAAMGALGVAALVQIGSSAPSVPIPALVAQIAQPLPGTKLPSGSAAQVRIRVQGGNVAALAWAVALRRRVDGYETATLANGTGVVLDELVAELIGDELVSGVAYLLELTATDGETTVAAQSEILVTDPQYALIPLDEGNRSQIGAQIYTVDGLGGQILYASRYTDPIELTLLRRQTGERELLFVDIGNSEGVRFTLDGARLFYQGHFPRPPGPIPGSIFGLGFLDLSTRISEIVDSDGQNFYSTDRAGRRLAYWGVGPGNVLQYFYYDLEKRTRRQLTDVPDAIKFYAGGDDCPQLLGTRPLISADGSTVVIITGSTLGLEPPDESIGCRVFTYGVEREEWRRVAALPRSLVVDVPTLSADGRWLSFRAQSRPGIPPSAVLLDLQTGELHDPVVDVGPLGSADSVVTADGEGIVVSARADLDPHVGNADHNLELFYYEFATRSIRQITETTNGVGSSPGGCPSYRPAVSRDGGVATFGFYLNSVESCRLDGPQRHERDGLMFALARAVRRRPGNRGPMLDPIADQRVVAGETIALSFAARDPEGDPISFYAQVKDGEDVPPGSTVTDHHDGTASFSWATRPEHAGATLLRVAAFDEGGGEVFQDVTLTVIGGERSPTPQATPTSTPMPEPCPADCNGNSSVGIDELLTAVRIALGRSPLHTCPPAACMPSSVVTVDCLTRAVGAALTGCP